MVKILLIAGHGEGDPGACALGYREADLTREVAVKLWSILSKYANVAMFDTNKDMYQYLNRGNAYNFKAFDYVLEIHFNSGSGNTAGDGKTTGSEALVHNSEIGTSVEKNILDRMQSVGFKNRGVKRRSDLLNMNICKGHQNVSYALLETCFIDDADDMRLYQSKKEQIVRAVASGILTGFGIGSSLDTEKVFPDINGHYAEKHIEKLADYEIIQGYFDGKYRPDDVTTRGEFSALVSNTLEKACGYSLKEQHKFIDTIGHWAELSIAKLTACGIVEGFNDRTFRPDEAITRGQAAMMSSNMLLYCGIPMKSGQDFSDTVGHYAQRHIASLRTLGVINGYDNGLFYPDKEITRGQAAIIISNCLAVLGK